jgi:hypothetical protein
MTGPQGDPGQETYSDVVVRNLNLHISSVCSKRISRSKILVSPKQSNQLTKSFRIQQRTTVLNQLSGSSRCVCRVQPSVTPTARADCGSTKLDHPTPLVSRRGIQIVSERATDVHRPSKDVVTFDFVSPESMCVTGHDMAVWPRIIVCAVEDTLTLTLVTIPSYEGEILIRKVGLAGD